jgi:hypothetical protein
MWLPLFAAGTGMAGAILADILTSRSGASRTAAYGMSLLCGFAVTLAAFLLGGLAMTDADWTGAGLLTLLFFCSWWFIALNFIQSFDSSLRVRILALLHAAGGRMSRATLEQSYNDQLLLELRLQRLLAHGYVVERNGNLFVASSQLRFFTRFFRALKAVLLGYRSEFDRPGNARAA